ncbi:uncharacterized protein ACRADG_007788 [Cochliomyia hominivorax]
MEKLILKKLFKIICLINVLTLLTGTYGMMPDHNMKTWTLDLKSISSKTSDPEKIEFDLQIKQVSRGVFALWGELRLSFDIFEGDSNYLSGKMYRTPQSNNDFKLLPFQMPSTHFIKVINTFYKDILMNSLKNCSDFPYFEDKFDSPFRKGVYKLEGCHLSEDGLPSHLEAGIYKTVVIGTGEAEYEIELITEAISNL